MRANELIVFACLICVVALIALALSMLARRLGLMLVGGAATIADACWWWRQRRQQRRQLEAERRRIDAFNQFSRRLAAFGTPGSSYGFFFLDKWAADQIEPEAYRLALTGVRFERREGCRHVRVVVER